MPPVSGSIIWARQLSRQLEGLMRRVEAVLGANWHLNATGKKLRESGDSLRKKLDTDPLFRQWEEDTKLALATSSSGPDHSVSGFVFNIALRNKQHMFSVAFDDRLIVLFKEVRNLEWLGYTKFPMAIRLMSSSVKQIYPDVVALRQIVKTYNACVAETSEEVRLVVQGLHRNCQSILSTGMKLKWSSLSRLQAFVASLSTAVSAFKAGLQQALEVHRNIEKSLSSLTRCPYDAAAMREHLEAIQKQVDQLDLAGHSNLRQWAQLLGLRVEEVLTRRLSRALDGFSKALGWKAEAAEKADGQEGEGEEEADIPVILQECLFQVVVKNGSMTVEPPLMEGRKHILRQLSLWMRVVVDLPLLQTGRYSLQPQAEEGRERDHSHLLARVSSGVLCRVYQLIEGKMERARRYLEQWLRYQGLWDMDQTVYAAIGSDLTAWQSLLVQIKQSRTLFEGTQSPEASSQLFPFRVDTTHVKSSVANKYDYWHRDILLHFGERVGNESKAFFEEISQIRQDFEGRSIAHDSAEGAVEFVIHLQDVERKVPAWTEKVALFGKSNDTLRKHRWTFPSDWLAFEMLEAEWMALTELIKRRKEALEVRIPALSAEIMKEMDNSEKAVMALQKEWETEGRPKGNAVAEQALMGLAVFSGRAQQMEERWTRLQSAAQALAGEEGEARRNEALKAIQEECAELKEVWGLLVTVWKQLRDLGAQAWGEWCCLMLVAVVLLSLSPCFSLVHLSPKQVASFLVACEQRWTS